MRQLSIEEIKKLELEMLMVFDNLCKENNLYYTLCGGTLLGAIRHKGFIPWDDDIDVMMPRPDFERLTDLIRENGLKLPAYMAAVSWFTKPRMDIPFVKLVDTRTVVEEKYMTNDKHLWIDILVMDGCPESNKKLKILFFTTKLLRKVLFLKCSKQGTGTTVIKATLKDLARLIMKPISGQLICQALERTSSQYDFTKSKSVGCIEWGYGPQERVNKEMWMMPTIAEFEGEKFTIPTNYDEYLTNLYGDYMKLPPVEKRVSHDMTVSIN